MALDQREKVGFDGRLEFPLWVSKNQALGSVPLLLVDVAVVVDETFGGDEVGFGNDEGITGFVESYGYCFGNDEGITG